MEQKKLLLVAISVGVFLIIAMGAAILIFGSGNNTPGMVTSRPIQAGTSAFPGITVAGDAFPPQITYDQIQHDLSGITEIPEDQTILQFGTEINIDNDNSNISGSGSSAVISVTRPSTAAVPDVVSSPRQAASSGTTTPAATVTPAPTARTTAPAATASTAARPASGRTHNDFWVQTGSFSTVARAEGVKDTLAGKGITSIIENREIEGTTYYRVRVGPYTSRNEADYWLSLIQSINGFESSQVWQTQSVR